MQQINSHQLWNEIKRQAARAKHRRAAIAYVTQDLLGLKKGDMLVTDASTAKIKAGDTDAKLLAMLHARGVAIHSCPGLHAKVILMDDVAVVGSANMSKSSLGLIEAAMITDSPAAVAQLEAFLKQLVIQSKQLSTVELAKLAAIEVVRHGTIPKPATAKISTLGSRVWIVGMHELAASSEEEEQMVEETRAQVAEAHEMDEKYVEWVKWSGSSAFSRDSLPGDRVIEMWRPKRSDKDPKSVWRPVPILLRKVKGATTHFFLGEPIGKETNVSWSVFKKAWDKLDAFDLKTGSARELTPEQAEALMRVWKD